MLFNLGERWALISSLCSRRELFRGLEVCFCSGSLLLLLNASFRIPYSVASFLSLRKHISFNDAGVGLWTHPCWQRVKSVLLYTDRWSDSGSACLPVCPFCIMLTGLMSWPYHINYFRLLRPSEASQVHVFNNFSPFSSFWDSVEMTSSTESHVPKHASEKLSFFSDPHSFSFSHGLFITLPRN